MQSVSYRIWIRVAVSISYNDNDYTTGTSLTPRAPPFGSMVKSQSLAQIPVNYLTHSIVTSLVLLLCKFAAFAYYVVNMSSFSPLNLLNFIPNIGIMVRVFANGPGDRGSIPGRVILKTRKMVLDATLLNTQYYKVRIKGKVEQSRERSSALPYTLV